MYIHRVLLSKLPHGRLRFTGQKNGSGHLHGDAIYTHNVYDHQKWGGVGAYMEMGAYSVE